VAKGTRPTSVPSDPSSRLAAIDMGQKFGAVSFLWGAGFLSNTMSPEPRPTFVSRGIVIHPFGHKPTIDMALPYDYLALSSTFITVELLIPLGAEFLMLCFHTNYEKVVITVSEYKHECHLAVSPEISLLHDFLAPVLL